MYEWKLKIWACFCLVELKGTKIWIKSCTRLFFSSIENESFIISRNKNPSKSLKIIHYNSANFNRLDFCSMLTKTYKYFLYKKIKFSKIQILTRIEWSFSFFRSKILTTKDVQRSFENSLAHFWSKSSSAIKRSGILSWMVQAHIQSCFSLKQCITTIYYN